MQAFENRARTLQMEWPNVKNWWMTKKKKCVQRFHGYLKAVSERSNSRCIFRIKSDISYVRKIFPNKWVDIINIIRFWESFSESKQ